MTYAIYFELGLESDTIDVVFIPKVDGPDGLSSPPSLWWRPVSSSSIAKNWKMTINQDYSSMTAPGIITDPKDILDCFENNIQQFNGISSHIKFLLGDPTHTLNGSFPVPLSDLILGELWDSYKRGYKLPSRLLAMISTAKNALGWNDPTKTVTVSNYRGLMTEWVDVLSRRNYLTNAGRILAGLHTSSSEERETLACHLLAAVAQDNVDVCHEFLEDESKSYTGQNLKTPEEKTEPVLEESRPTYTRPNGDLYYARKWGKFWDVEVLKTARSSGQYTLLAGPPGTGKTAMAEGAFGSDLVTIVMTGETTVSEMVGSFIPDGAGGYIWIDGPLLVAVQEGRPILVDEILLGDPKVLSVLYPLMDGRGFLDVTENPDIGVVKAKEGFFLIGSGNPGVPGAKMSGALTSRFPLQVEVTTDYDLALSMGVDESVVTFASALATRASGRKATISWAPQFRELLAFKKTEELWGRAFAIQNLMRLVPRQDLEAVQNVARTVFPGADLKAARI